MILQSLIGALSVFIAMSCFAQNPTIIGCSTRFGTLEIGDGKMIFEWGGEQEIFDLSAKAYLESSNFLGPMVPGLREIGVKSVAGNIYKYGNKPKSTVLLQLQKEKPDEIGQALLFENETGKVVEINLIGKTPVVRVDLQITSSRKPVTIWNNLKVEELENLLQAIDHQGGISTKKSP